MGGQAGIDIKAVGEVIRGTQRKAQDPGQGRLFDQFVTQIGHRLQSFVQFDQQRRTQGGVRSRLRSWPGTVSRTFGEVLPIQLAEERQIFHGRSRFAHQLRQRLLGRLRQLPKRWTFLIQC